MKVSVHLPVSLNQAIALAERVGQGKVGGKVGGYIALGDKAWLLSQLAIEKAWSELDGLFLYFLVKTYCMFGTL